jgi:hypothetical protein
MNGYVDIKGLNGSKPRDPKLLDVLSHVKDILCGVEPLT